MKGNAALMVIFIPVGAIGLILVLLIRYYIAARERKHRPNLHAPIQRPGETPPARPSAKDW